MTASGLHSWHQSTEQHNTFASEDVNRDGRFPMHKDETRMKLFTGFHGSMTNRTHCRVVMDLDARK